MLLRWWQCNSILIGLTLFCSCASSQSNSIVVQIYPYDQFLTVLRADPQNSEKKYLTVYRNGKQISRHISLSKPPCQILLVDSDSILVQYYLFTSDTSLGVPARSSYVDSIDSKMKLVEKFVRVQSTSIENTIVADSIHILKKKFIAFWPRGKETFDLNNVLYDGQKFFVRRFESASLSATIIELRNRKEMQSAYFNFAKMVPLEGML